MFEYDVALSFAGEQRAQVLQVAECLKKACVRVFYDEDAKATLWGKNLYDHLSDIYQHKARCGVIFASREYAEKTWTNLERQNAQARALQNKSAEYGRRVLSMGRRNPDLRHRLRQRRFFFAIAGAAA